jgi:hypothetical protein
VSNKRFQKLNEIDQIIRRLKPPGMDDGVHVTIEYFTGFELFNTRPYHNYEAWSGGYRVKGLGAEVESEDLDDAVKKWASHIRTIKTTPKGGE